MGRLAEPYNPNGMGVTELDETKYVIGEMTPNQETLVAAKNSTVHYNVSRYWEPTLERGQEYWRALEGKCFTKGEMKRYEDEDKIPVEIPIILPKVNALVGMQRATRKDGVIVPVGAEDAPDADSINIVVKAIRQQNFLDQQFSEVFKNAIVSGYPAFLWFDQREADGKRDLDIYAETWNSVLIDPNYKRTDMSDIQFLIRVRLVSKDQLLEAYPERRDAILGNLPRIDTSNSYEEENILTSDDRELIFAQANSASSLYERTGMITVIERLHFKLTAQNVYVSAADPEAQTLPQNWDDQRIKQWEQENQDYQKVVQNVKTLWVTTSTTSNILLENRAHWYQEQQFPCAMYQPAEFNNKPVGWVQHLVASQKMNSVARTEHLHSQRNTNDKLMVVKENALSDPERATREKAKTGGIVTIRDDYDVQSDIRFENDQSGNTGYLELGNLALNDVDFISAINPAMLGMQESANESRVAIERRISQAQVAQGMYMDNYHMFEIMGHKVLLNMLPYILTDERLMRYTDEKGKEQETTINQQQGYDQEGAQMSVLNNMAGARYDYMIGTGDNSITGLEEQNRVFETILRDILPQIPEDSWSALLENMPNYPAQEFGRAMAERQERITQEQAANGPKVDPAKIQINLDSKGVLTKDPVIMGLLQANGLLPSEAEQQNSEQMSYDEAGQMEDAAAAGGTEPAPQEAPA